MAKVKLRPKARSDLEDIWLYGVQRWGLDQADDYLKNLDETFQLLSCNPLMAKEIQDFEPPVRIHPHASHIIIYETKSTYVSVIRVLHKSMMLSRHID